MLWISDFRDAQYSDLTFQSLLWCRKLKEKGVEPVLCNVMPLDIRSHPVMSEVMDMKLIYPVGDVLSAVQKIDPDVVLIYGAVGAHLHFELPDITREYPTCYYALLDPLELLLNSKFTSDLPRAIDFMQKMDHIIAPSEVMEARLRSYGCMDITVIPPSADPSQYSPTDCTDPTICILAKTSPVRNHLTLIEAVSLVREEIPEVELAIVPWREMLGGNADLPAIYSEVLQRLGLTPQVKFTGEIRPKELFREVSILADPSFSNTSASAILQAYLHGVPCVISEGGWSKMFNAPFTAYPDDPQGWAEALTDLLTDRKTYRMARERQHQELIDKFNINKNIEELIEVFTDLQQLQPYKVKRK